VIDIDIDNDAKKHSTRTSKKKAPEAYAIRAAETGSVELGYSFGNPSCMSND
jgi:hypothetical protein